MPDEMQSPAVSPELATLQEEVARNLAGWQRAQADYANLKRESEQIRSEFKSLITADLMSQLLPIYNHFQLALKHIPADQRSAEWVVGLGHIAKQFEQFLEQYDVRVIPTVGEQFDPHRHEAVAHEPHDGSPPDQIFEEVMPGYVMGEMVLIPAKVKVAQ